MRLFCRVLGATCLLAFVACATPSDDESASTESLTGSAADLTISSATGPISDLTAGAGSGFVIMDTVLNQGLLGAAASVTSYTLSADGTTSYPKSKLGQRSVGALGIGLSDVGLGASVVLPTAVPDGDYSVRACADALSAIPESNEANNCALVTHPAGGNLIVHLASPDLVESSVSDPPGTAVIGDKFDVTDSVSNLGGGDAAASVTNYYLSANGVTKTKFLGSRGQASIATRSQAPSVTTSISLFAGLPAGTYYLMACVDGANVVVESNETNNCLSSAHSMVLTGPNLMESGVSLGTTAVDIQSTLAITETTSNTGNAPADISRVKIYASTDTVHDTSDLFVIPTCSTGPDSGVLRVAPALGPTDQSTATSPALLCFKESGTGLLKPMPVGTYYLFACADGGSTVAETNESDNCAVSATAVTLTSCGNNVLEVGETCDDGNAVAGDGCSATCQLELPVSIAVTPANPTVVSGDTEAFTATETFSDGFTLDVTATATWSSATTTVATMVANVATGAATGTSTITASLGSLSGTTTLTVTPLVLVSIDVTPGTASIAKGLTQGFTATGTYNNGSTQDLTATATWSATDGTVATMSGATATGAGVGTTTITATVGAVSGTASLTVTAAELVTIDVQSATSTIAVGTSLTFSATGTYTDNSTLDVTSTATWTSSLTTVATMSANTATGVATGTTTIKAAIGSISGTTSLSVTTATLKSIDVEPADPTIARGTTVQLTATGIFTNGTSQDLTTQVTWSTQTAAVATVSTGGLVTGVGAGSSKVTATLGSISDFVTVTVTSATVTSIAVTPATATIARGTTQQFTATATFNDGTTQDVTSLATWGTSSSTLATVTAGLATGNAPGTATISASFGGQVGSAALTVTAATLVSIAVTPTTVQLPKSYWVPLTAIGTYNDGSTQDITKLVTWSSSKKAVVAVSNATPTKGRATASGLGTATITATLGAISATMTFTCTSATLSSIAITPSSATLARRGTVQLTATGTFSDLTTLDLTQQVTWKSSKKSVASVKTGLVTGKAVGSATITANKASAAASAAIAVQ